MRRSSIRLKRLQSDPAEEDNSSSQKKTKVIVGVDDDNIASASTNQLERSSASDSRVPPPSPIDPTFKRILPLSRKMVTQSDSNMSFTDPILSGTSNRSNSGILTVINKSPGKNKVGKSHLSASEKQTELARQKGTIWSMLLLPDAEGIKEAVSLDPSVLDMRDAVNATPLLLLCLYHSPQHVEIFKDIVATRLGAARLTDSYGEGPYRGETCLHLAIVHQDLELACLIVQLCPKLVHMRTEGIFFAREGRKYHRQQDEDDEGGGGSGGVIEEISTGRCYFGHLPLSFAVSTNNAEMVLMLLERGADIEDDDEEGNNAMHMAVLCGNMAMFTLLENELKRKLEKRELISELKSKFDVQPPPSPSLPKLVLERQHSRGIFVEERVPLPFRLNKEGYNCFELAAAYGSTETFEALLDSLRVKQWY